MTFGTTLQNNLTMRYLSFFLIVLYTTSGSPVLLAQTNTPSNAQILVEKLLNAKVFIDYSNLKKDIENQVSAVNRQTEIDPAGYSALQTAYNRTKDAFDVFLNTVRQDMLDFQLFEQAASGDEPTLLRYLAAYNAGVDVYNREFMPAYGQVVRTRKLPGWLAPLGIQAFGFLATITKGKNPRQDVIVNDLLLVSNYLFLQKLQMKSWEELVTVRPREQSGGYQDNSNAPAPDGFAGNMPDAATPPLVPAGPDVELPVMKSLSGQLEFRVAGAAPRPMAFELPAAGLSRDLVVGGADDEPSTSGPPVDAGVALLRSADVWKEGTAFQIRVQNSALLYAFALNSNGTCAPIYPFSEAWVRGFNMSKTRDLSVGPLMLKDESGEVVIPAPNALTGQENYIRITGSSAREQLCLIVSRSELDLNDIMSRIAALSGSLAERVATLWQDEPHRAAAADANLRAEGGTLRFDVADAEKWLLPLVFEIRR